VVEDAALIRKELSQRFLHCTNSMQMVRACISTADAVYDTASCWGRCYQLLVLVEVDADGLTSADVGIQVTFACSGTAATLVKTASCLHSLLPAAGIAETLC